MRARRAVVVGGALILLAGCGGSAARTHPSGPGHVPVLGPLQSSGAGNRFFEVYEPPGPARGTMLMLHGGGWADQRGDARRYLANTATAFRGLGWRVVNVSYTPGRKPPGVTPDPVPMLDDVVAFYDQIRRAYGGPICAYGESAGAHLAAMLALERPSLNCAILNAAPLDLPTLMHHTVPLALQDLRQTFGTSQGVLAQWSPARQWRPSVDHTAVFATAAANDAVVPPQQLSAFAAADPSANVAVVRGAVGSGNAVRWVHSAVDRASIYARVASLYRWLGRFARPARTPPAADPGADCDLPPRPGDRWKLLLAGDAWQQASSAREPIAATRGCSGSASWQDDGLSLWAAPSSTAVLPSGAEALLVLNSAQVLRRLTAVFRGFLARPQDWAVGLYASNRRSGAIKTPVAVCVRGICSGLRLFRTSNGGLISASGSRGDPDQVSQPPAASFSLPPGTHRLAWELTCAAPAGCPLAGIAKVPGISPRPRDPLGHPAIFSLYRIEVS